MSEFIMLDTETTGLGRQRGREDAIVSVGAVYVVDGSIEDSFESYCWPGEKFFLNGRADEALRVNGIDMEKLKNSPGTNHVSKFLREWVHKKAPVTLTTYNMGFDRPFLDADPWLLGNLPLVSWGKCAMIAVAEEMGRIGLNEYNDYYQNWKWMKLELAARRLKIPFEPGALHSALADARIAATIVAELKIDI